MKKEKIDILISPVLPYTGVMHGDGKMLINTLAMCSFQNILDMPAGTIPIRLV